MHGKRAYKLIFGKRLGSRFLAHCLLVQFTLLVSKPADWEK